MSSKLLILIAGLVVLTVSGIAVVAAMAPPTPGSAAYFRAMSAANRSGSAPAYAVPVETRRAAANSCEGYNLELQEGAGIQMRLGHHGEAQRLLSLRRDCSIASDVVRSAR
ncbi:hypothetical protein [Falsiroseomonas sp. CW058]|uniref:hypothetical protein n=1 Tax=Falsiroseomonas sp. CW058 TaxID=3388664 RepID=UPI003D30F64A